MKISTPHWQSLGHLLREQAERNGNRPLFRFDGTDTTFAEIEESTNRLANVLSAHGVAKGDHVAVLMSNGIGFPTVWMAIAKVGAVMVPINVQYQETDLAYTLNDSGAVLAIADAQQIEKLQRVRTRCASLQEICLLSTDGAPIDSDLRVELEQAPSTYAIDHVCQKDLLNLQYTSGTTGFPKGCMLTHEYLLMLGQEVAEYGKFRDGDVALTAQPFYYLDPQWNTVMCMMAGVPLVILERFSASTFWQSVKDNEVTFFYLLGTMPIYLLKQPENAGLEKTHRVRFVLCSGIVPQLHATFESRWNVRWREVYGTTESGADLFVPLEDETCVGTGAIGKPFSSKEAKVIDAVGNELADNMIGELLVRGKPMMLGYYNKPAATAEKIRDGWLYTGDLVFRDEKGYYHIVGRLKEMIRRSGENISAAEVEAVLCEHPSVRAAAVVPVPDELRGEEVKAFVQLQPGETAETTPPQVLVDFARSKLASFKAPRFIEYVNDFPRTPSERIAKHKLLEMKDDQRLGAYDAQDQKWNSCL